MVRRSLANRIYLLLPVLQVETRLESSPQPVEDIPRTRIPTPTRTTAELLMQLVVVGGKEDDVAAMSSYSITAAAAHLLAGN
jgi:hypothetical protein